jgi:hypothetical protein
MPGPYPINDAVMLHFDWAEVLGETITSVRGQPGYYEGSGVFWWRTAILIGQAAIMIEVNNDTDEIIVTLKQDDLPMEEAPLDLAWIDVPALSELVGRKLGWCWTARNSQGYLDAFMIAVDGIDPTYMFIGMASCVQIKKIAESP